MQGVEAQPARVIARCARGGEASAPDPDAGVKSILATARNKVSLLRQVVTERGTECLHTGPGNQDP
jgi:hypothetical protein